MPELRWLDQLPGGTLEGGIERANELLNHVIVGHSHFLSLKQRGLGF